MEFGILEIIGLAFLSGLKIEEITKDIKEEYDNKREVEAKCNTEEINNTENIESIEIKKITKEEMGEIFDMLKNKMLGGKNNG